MALSNIRNEPQREITESLIGLLPLLLLIPLYFWSQWILSIQNVHFSSKADWYVVTAFTMLMSVAGVFVIYLLGYGFLHLTHSFGESICGFMAKRGIDPRPKIRKQVRR